MDVAFFIGKQDVFSSSVKAVPVWACRLALFLRLGLSAVSSTVSFFAIVFLSALFLELLWVIDTIFC